MDIPFNPVSKETETVIISHYTWIGAIPPYLDDRHSPRAMCISMYVINLLITPLIIPHHKTIGNGVSEVI